MKHEFSTSSIKYYANFAQKMRMIIRSLVIICIIFPLFLLDFKYSSVIVNVLISLLMILLLYMALSILLNLTSYIEISIDGIAYHSYGFSIYSPWENTIGVDRIVHPYNPSAYLFRHSVNVLVLRSPALFHKPISEGKQENVAVIEKCWGCFFYRPETYASYFPLFIEDVDQNTSQRGMGEYIRQYAPWVFSESSTERE